MLLQYFHNKYCGGCSGGGNGGGGDCNGDGGYCCLL